MKKRAAFLGLVLAVSLCSCRGPSGERARAPEDAGKGVTIRITRAGGGRAPAMTVEVDPGQWEGEIVLRIAPER